MKRRIVKLETDVTTLIMGEHGGRLAIAFAAGCAVTFGFIHKYIIKPHLVDCESKIKDLNRRIEALEAVEGEYLGILKARSGLLKEQGYVVE